jgi:TonB-linked SusC/RagA family outer membrane protein
MLKIAARRMLLLGYLIGLAALAQAQKTMITGTVLNESGRPLGGATVLDRKNHKVVLTNSEGIFSLEGDKGDALIVTYVGYEDQQVTAKAGAFQVTMALSRTSLNEVVVIGYGTARKRDLVSATDVVAAKDAGNTTATNPSELLIGKAAGVQVLQSNGNPGADAQIIVRGTGSFTSVDPLYVIDGIQADKNLFNALSTQDIENITILKDAASTAIYGVAAANGVVIITTKRGHNGPPRITVTSQWGEATAWKQLHLLNASQYVDLLKDFAATSNTALPAKFSTSSVLVDSTDWQKEIFRHALVSENDVNISGGGDKINYSFSAGYITQESIVKALTNKRLNIRMGVDETLGRFHFGQSIAFRNTNTAGQMATIGDAIGYAPYKPIYDPTVQSGYSIVSNIADFSNVNNPLQETKVQYPVTNEYVLFPQTFGEVNLFAGIKFRTQFSAEVGNGKYTEYQYPYVASNYLAFPRKAFLGYNDYSYYTWENYLSFNRTFGLHAFSATLGNSYLSPGNSASLQAYGTGIANDNIQNISVSQAQTVNQLSYNSARPSVISYYGRLMYTYDDKYILSASGRRDGSSNFGVNDQFGNFYGVGAAWRFMQETFAKKTFSFLDDGKLRIGYGTTGNNNFPNFLTVPLTFSGSPSGALVYSLGPNEAFVPGTTISTVANPNLHWEQTGQFDAGLELSFLDNRLHVNADYYDRKSKGLLVSIPLPASGGADLTGTNPTEEENAANAENKGVELGINFTNRAGKDFTYNIGVNGSYNKNNVLSLGSQFAAPIQAGTFSNLSTFTITQAGSPIGSYYGYVVDHVAKDQSEIDALNAAAAKKTGNPGAVYQQGLLPGDFIFKDLSGDGTVTTADQKVLGNPIPKFIYGINAGITFKDFDLNLVVSGVAGLKILNAMKFTTETEATGHNATTAILNRWRQPGDVAALPRAGQDDNSSGNLRASDWWLENGNYMRLRNLTIGYTIPGRYLHSFAGSAFARIRLYVAAQNLLTLTHYSGYDPEISTQGGLNTTQYPNYIFTRGIDDGELPQPRTFLAGIQLGF